MYKIGFLGGGTMAEAILSGLINHSTISSSHNIIVAEINAARREVLQAAYPALSVTESAEEMIKSCDMIFTASGSIPSAFAICSASV